MNISAEHKQLIQDYYDGLLSADQELELKLLVVQNPDVADEFKSMGIVVESIRTYGFRLMLEGLQRRHFPDDAAATKKRDPITPLGQESPR
jgi:hypothetical protein